MRKSQVTQLTKSKVLGPFVRTGMDGGCLACMESIADHFGSRGEWLGCKGVKAVAHNVPFILVPVLMKTVLDKTTTIPQERRSVTPASKPASSRKSAPASLPLGPQVAYVASYPLTHKKINELPPSDRKVYGLIARNRKSGATRGHLLDQLHARQSTGKVDGAVRRLRIRKVITVQPLAA